MRLQFGALGVTMSWDDGFLGARASRPHQAWHSLGHLTWINGNGAMALLRLGRCGSRPQGGCLQHRAEAQRRPKGQDAGGTPALPGDAVPAAPWGVSGGRLLRKPTCTLWETPVCPRDRPPPCRANHSSAALGTVRPLLHYAVPDGAAFTGSAWIYGLQQNQENRTNLALVNTGEVE